MVTVPRLPECITWGRSQDEAIRNAREAIRCCLSARRSLGQVIPRPLRRVAKVVTVDIAA